MTETAIPQFNIQIGNELTWNVLPILHEIRHALAKLVDTGASSIIDLRSIPLAPGEEDTIIDTLGCGEVHATLNALGPSEIHETRFAGVWLITHYNEENSIIGRFIEITGIPDILKSQHEDMALSLTQLEEQLEENPTSNSNETHAETNT
ncbi:MAG: hydrogenase expression/formation C-terminal domain-containing protein [Gammaproteobacteria bacterium]|jgi:hydrogenase-1 operon protein HyaF